MNGPPTLKSDLTFDVLFEAIELCQSGFAIYNEDFDYIYANQTAHRNWPVLYKELERGESRREATRKQVKSQYANFDDDRIDQLTDYVYHAMSSEQAREVTTSDHRKVLTFHEQTSTGAIVGISIDVTELRDREAELAVALEEVAHANNTKSDFLARMSHEIRTPMNGILGMAELLTTTTLDPTQKSYVDVLQRSGSALLAIINNVLDVSKIETGKLKLEQRPFSLRDVVNDVVGLLSTQAARQDVDLQSSMPEDLPELLVGDQFRLRKVLLHIVGNALKFTSQGFVHIEVAFTKEGQSAAVSFRVRDTGIGIPDDEIGGIFDRFTEADQSLRSEQTGPGLGLTISRSIIEAMSGEIWVTSEYGTGSLFGIDVTLPIAGSRPKDGPRSINPDLSRYRILISDQDGEQSLRLSTFAEAWGAEILPEVAFDEIVPTLEADEATDKGPTILVLVAPKSTTLTASAEDPFGDPGMDRYPRLVINNSGESSAEVTSTEAHAANRVTLVAPVTRDVFADTLQQLVSAIEGSSNNGTQDSHDTPATTKPEKLHMLIAEDNEVNRLVIEHFIDPETFSIQFAFNGADAVRMFKEMSFDAVLMDISMPVMDGISATKEIRAFEKAHGRQPVPIIALTAHAMAGDREQLLTSGLNEYVAKPIQKELLDQVISDLILNRAPPNEFG